MAINYAKSGVDRLAADELVDKIGLLVKPTLNPSVKAAIGGYASLYRINRDSFLAASTDGVGTKLKLAFDLNIHNTIGVDLVAMSVNDILCVGAKPLFFLDYFSTSKLSKRTGIEIIRGIVSGCQQAGCALVGGETAEMPGFYSKNEYDLAGFAVGLVSRNEILPKRMIKPGDVLIGLASSGFHSNGFSLIRKLLTKKDSRQFRRKLLTPTKIYVKSLLPLINGGVIKGLAHITGSGFLNVPRISENVDYEIVLPRYGRGSVFAWAAERAGLSLGELCTTFNMGIGMVAVVSPTSVKGVLAKLGIDGETASVVGRVNVKVERSKSTVTMRKGTESAKLYY